MLLAKPDESLIEHTENALKVFSSLRKAYPDVPELCNVRQFWENLFFAIFLHDFGKGARGFQEQLTTGKKWNYRHEILSAGFVSALDIPEEDKMAIGLAIITHHKDIQELREKYATYPEDNPGFGKYQGKLKELDLKGMNDFLNYIPDFSQKYLEKKLLKFHHIKDYKGLTDVYKEYVLPYYRQYRLDKRTPLHRKYGTFLKGFLTASDHLASAGEYEIKKVVSNINKYITFPRLTSVQEKAKEHTGNLFIISPTGSGKTETALFWAHNNQNAVKSKRIFYILPYTASINYMYKRFVKLFSGDELVGILHGKSSYFIYKFFIESNKNISYDKAKNYAKIYGSLARKIFKPYKILTPFQIIKAFFNLKGFEQNISEMAEGLFIFDEIHSYDPHTTALILEISRFIKNELKGTFLFMTATMPEFLKQFFKDELGIENEITMDREELENFSRHRIEILEGEIWEHIDKIHNDICSGKKVLVVVNTVKQAQEIFKALMDINPDSSALLHSRFILRDREKIESALNSKNLLVGTQVIEVSLDIDYDVLYTEPAPIDALLQRFGRVNRQKRMDSAPVYIFTEGSGIGHIYNKERTEKSLQVLDSTNILNELLVQKMVDEVYKEGYSEEESKIIREVSENFRQFYKDNVPFIDIHKKESEFYNLFKSVEVIPSSFFDEYVKEIESKRFFESVKYIVPISLPQYNYLKREQRISKSDYGIIVESTYNSELGLQIQEEPNEANIL